MSNRQGLSPPRRTFLQILLGGVALALARLLQPRKAQSAAMVSQKAAAYQDHPNDGNHCSECRFFQGDHSCKIIAGSISPNGWCKYYTAA
ncbi:MAG TPA: high-potential iron-sulfur protein [Roseiarcus sp.]|jgi:hypothetical protein|nr:high-potential iron-sulfur protein [Roseiarcus sp.]